MRRYVIDTNALISFVTDRNLEQQQNVVLQRYQVNAAQIVYGDILWGLFNSTEFTFNH